MTETPESRPRHLGLALDPGAARERWRFEQLTLGDLVRTLWGRRWSVALLVLAGLLAGAGYLAVATPVYQSNALIQVAGKPTRGSGPGELGALFGDQSPGEIEPEMELIRSRTLLSGVVEELGLDLEAGPRRFPILGGALARRHAGGAPAAPLFGLSRYGWGGERIRVSRLTLPDDLLGAPLRLLALGEGRYRVEARGGALSFEGKVGEPGVSKGRWQVELVVSELVARPGTEFTITRHRLIDVTERLQRELHMAAKAKKSGLLVLALEGTDPVRTAEVLNAVAARYLEHSVARDSVETTKALEFLDARLPALKAKADSAEAALDALAQAASKPDPSVESQAIVAQGLEIEKELARLEQQQAELGQRYTDKHPVMVELAAKVRRLRSQQSEATTRVRQLPPVARESTRLTREATQAREEYLRLLGETKLLRAAKAVAVRAVVLDKALVPLRPASPKPLGTLALAAMLGLAVGCARAFARKPARADGAGPVDEIEQTTGLPVLAALPHSRRLSALTRSRARRHEEADLPVLAAEEPLDPTVENIRALRTGLRFAADGPRRKVVAVLGAGRQVGKSFLCANLAHTLAAAERRVLLIDADLRYGRAHKYFGIGRQPGLADYLNGTARLEAALHRRGYLDVLPAGSNLFNPAELLARPRFEELLAGASRRYDLVIVDTAPLLAFADAMIVAGLAGLNVLVLRAARHPVREVALAVRRLERCRSRLHGIVLNDLRGGREAATVTGATDLAPAPRGQPGQGLVLPPSEVGTARPNIA